MTNTIKSEEQVQYGNRKEKQQAVDRAIAIMELQSRVRTLDYIESPQDLVNLLRLRFASEDREHFVVVFLNSRNGVLGIESLFKGTVDGCVVRAKEVFRAALRHNAVSIVLCHNHPSGNIQPSTADKIITKELIDLGFKLDIKVIDHIIVTEGGFFSFNDHGLI